MNQTIALVSGDTMPVLEFTIEKDGEAVNLTGATVVFSMYNEEKVLKIDKQACTITNATGGVVQYQLQSGDTSEEGAFSGEIQVTDSNSGIQTTFEAIPITVRRQVA